MPLSSDFLEPIPGDDPAGESLRYDPVYDQIKQARIEEPDVPQGAWETERKTADYPQVIKLATEVLTKRSKDLQIAAWLTEALLHRQGFAGLNDGLDLLHQLLDRFWDNVYPEIDEDGDTGRRTAPLEWVGQYLDVAAKFVPLTQSGLSFIDYKDSRAVGYEDDTGGDPKKVEARNKAMQAGKPSAEQFDEAFGQTPKPFYKQLVKDLNAALAALKSLDTLCEEKFTDEPPSFGKLRDALQEVHQVAGQLLAKKLETDPDPPELEAETAALEAGAVAMESGAAAPAAGGISAEPRSRDDAAARIGAAARYLRSSDPADPAPYLMLRGFRWGELRARGGEIDPKLLAAPPTDVRTRLKSSMLDAHWPQLLETAEEVMATPFGRGWLDLQRYVLAACDGLGAQYHYVAAAVRGSLRSLIEDLPQLPELTLMDDSPTANAETRKWLRDTVLNGAAALAAAAGAGEDADPSHGAAYDRAMEKLRSGQPEKAIGILMREAAQEKSLRARFLRRSQAARIMVDSGMEPVAMPILQEMMQLIEKHDLEEWEDGETIAQPIGLLYRCLEKLNGDATTRQQLYLRVCRLDPLQAMHFGSTADESGS
jgi:type VI secretion system protein ImpA